MRGKYAYWKWLGFFYFGGLSAVWNVLMLNRSSSNLKLHDILLLLVAIQSFCSVEIIKYIINIHKLRLLLFCGPLYKDCTRADEQQNYILISSNCKQTEQTN